MSSTLFIETLWRQPRIFFAVAIIVIFSICCHEFMHAYVALRLGDSTAADRGHLTLNPLKQMGPWSLLLFAFFGLAWGQVPVNPQNMRGRYAPAWVAAAGPLTNLALAVIFDVLAFICLQITSIDLFAPEMLFHGAVLNVVLFLLNMLPVPGFDGFAILLCLRPRLLTRSSEVMRGAFFVIIVLLFVSINYFFKLGELSAGKLLQLLEWVF